LLFPLNTFISTTDTPFVKVHIEVENQDANIVSINAPKECSEYNPAVFSQFQNIKGGKILDIALPLNYSTFLKLKINNETNIYLAVAPHDSISIQLRRWKQDNYSSYTLKFEGSNAIAHEIYNERFIPAGKNLNFFDGLFRQPISYSDFYTQSKDYIDSITKIWDSLRINHLVTREVYELYKSDTKSFLYNEPIKKLARIEMDTTWENYVQWMKIREVMFFQGDAQNKILLKTEYGIQLYQLYLLDILRKDDYIKDTLLRADQLGYYYYYDTAYRERVWGEELRELEEMFPGPSSVKGDIDMITVFKSYYPNSIYAITHYDSVLNERKQFQEQPINISENTLESLKDIFTSTNERYFYIDVWATWCNPCLAELNYYTAALYKFLDSHHIKIIFLSVDKTDDKEKWETVIKNQYMRGSHYLISNDVQKELLKILLQDGNEGNSFMIPQYLLYDKQHDKYYTGLPRPSTKEALQLFLQNIVDKSQ
jgi:thiol-disulfide isomerase/thioredoxin